jgi:hypothetical protein
VNPTPTRHRASWKYLILGFIFSLVCLEAWKGITIVDFRNSNWILGTDQQYQYLGGQFFQADEWHWPPYALLSLNPPIPFSVGNLDPVVPLLYGTKLLRPLWNVNFQFYGLWILACMFFLWYFSFRIFRNYTKDDLNGFLAGIIVLLSPVFMYRFGHLALLGQFLILWAFSIWLDPKKKKSDLPILVNQLAASCIQPYLGLMCLAINFFGLASLKRWLAVGALFLVWVFSSWICGFFALPSFSMPGFGIYSTDFLTFINSMGTSRFFPSLRNVAGSYEGYCYLGLGMFLLGLVSLYSKKKYKVTTLMPGFLWLSCLLLFGLALMPHFRIGGNDLLHSDLNTGTIGHLFEIFRTNGRFVWPLYYLVAVAILVVILQLKNARVLLLGCLLLQVVDVNFLSWTTTLKSYVGEPDPFAMVSKKDFPAGTDHLQLVPYTNICYGDSYFLKKTGLELGRLALRLGWKFSEMPQARFDLRGTKGRCEKQEADLLAGIGEASTVYAILPDFSHPISELTDHFRCEQLAGFNFCWLNRN